jgi:hypothetical protein
MAAAKRRNLVQFVNAAGERKTIRVGSLDRRAADLVASHVRHLVNASISRSAVPRETAVWLAEVSDRMHAKLARAGIVEPREAAIPAELKAFLDGYIDKRRPTLKPATIANLKQAGGWLVKFFGARRDLRTINRGEARDWHLHLKAKLAGPTVAMHVKKVRQMFADAAERRLIGENPFDHLKAGSSPCGGPTSTSTAAGSSSPPARPSTTLAAGYGLSRCSRSCCHTCSIVTSRRRRDRSTSSRATATPTTARWPKRSSAGPASTHGQSCSRTCGRRGRRSWPTSFR